MTRLIPFAALVCASAHAAPMRIDHSARLLNSVGTPIEGNVTIHARLFNAASGPTELYADSFPTTAEDGYVHIVLGSGTQTLQTSAFDNAEVWLELQVGTDPPLTPRDRLASVAHAARSARADGIRMLAGTLPATCDNGELVYAIADSSLRLCDTNAWVNVGASAPTPPWINIDGRGTLSDGIWSDSIWSPPLTVSYDGAMLAHDFTGDFEVIATWGHSYPGFGIVYGPNVTYADNTGTGASHFWNTMGNTGFGASYDGSFTGVYLNSIKSTSTAIWGHRWSRTGTSVSIQYSSSGSGGPWTHISGSPVTVPLGDVVVVGIGEAYNTQSDPLRLVSVSID